MSELRDTFGDWMTSTVTVATNRGAGAYGPDLADPIAVDEVMVSNKRRWVRNSEGNLTPSESSILAEMEHLPKFTGGSEVTLPNGTTTTVITAASDSLLFDALVVSLE
jgi:hypothetical protein